MSPITMSGSLTTLSTNGDGPQLLTEAAEFLNALAQMGVQMAVEINLRPVGAETASAHTRAAVGWLAHPVSTGQQPPTTLAVGATDPALVLRTPGTVTVAAAPVDPTPAAPAQPDAPQWNLTPHPVRSSAANPEWRKLSREQRHNLLHVEGRMLARKLGHAPTMAEWDAHKPAEYPTASALPKFLQAPWVTLASGWAARESVLRLTK